MIMILFELSPMFYLGIMCLLIYDVGAKSFDYIDHECPTRLDPAIFFSSNQEPRGSAERAKKTFPKDFFLDKSGIQLAGLGVISRTFVRKYTWLGEYEGDVLADDYDHDCGDNDDSNCGDYAWTMEKRDGSNFFVDAFDEATSNWLRYVNCARHVLEENVDSAQCYGRRYYLTVRDIAPGQELLVYYGDEYARELGIVVEQFYNREFWTRKYQANKQSARQRLCKVVNSFRNRFCET